MFTASQCGLRTLCTAIACDEACKVLEDKSPGAVSKRLVCSKTLSPKRRSAKRVRFDTKGSIVHIFETDGSSPPDCKTDSDTATLTAAFMPAINEERAEPCVEAQLALAELNQMYNRRPSRYGEADVTKTNTSGT